MSCDRSAIVGMGEDGAGGSALGNCGPVELDRPWRIRVALRGGGAQMRRRPLHSHRPRNVPPFHRRPPPARLPLQRFRPRLGGTLRPRFGFRRLCIRHIIGEKWVTIRQRFRIFRSGKFERWPIRVRFLHGGEAPDLGAVLKAVIFEMAAVSPGAHVRQRRRRRREMVAFLIRVPVMAVAIAILQATQIHLHDLYVLFHFSVDFLQKRKNRVVSSRQNLWRRFCFDLNPNFWFGKITWWDWRRRFSWKDFRWAECQWLAVGLESSAILILWVRALAWAVTRACMHRRVSVARFLTRWPLTIACNFTNPFSAQRAFLACQFPITN